jgi:hypothetical protein
MGPLYDQVGGDGGSPSSPSNTNININTETNNVKSGFRKYALLVQDSLAIKFVPVSTESHHHLPNNHQPFPYSSHNQKHQNVGNNNNNNNNPLINDNVAQEGNRNDNNEQQQHQEGTNTSEKSVNKRDQHNNNGNGCGIAAGALLRSSRLTRHNNNEDHRSPTRDVDHSLHALYLFKVTIF